MSRDKVYNFSAGPSVMPESVLRNARSEIMDFRSSGMSVMEISHRSKLFMECFSQTKEKLRAALNVPDTHEILFLQGGATLQFASVPMNLIGRTGSADYAVTGNFANVAAREAEKYGRVNIACSSADREHSYIPAQSEIKLSSDASYFYYCANNTIYGTAWQYIPDTKGTHIVCDMSSEILSRPVDVSRYGLIFAGAQKNMAPAGLTVVIVDKALTGEVLPCTPKIMDYRQLIEKDSMINTPPCWCIYMLGLTLDWLESEGGVEAMERNKLERAKLLYDYLDESSLFKAHAEKSSRSCMNVTFRTGDENLDAEFLKDAEKSGLLNLKGHRLTGGMRASLYNAMPVEGVEALVKYMKKFEVTHSV